MHLRTDRPLRARVRRRLPRPVRRWHLQRRVPGREGHGQGWCPGWLEFVHLRSTSSEMPPTYTRSSASSSIALPAAYQEATLFGTNTGGVNPALVSASSTAAYDAWLTVGIKSDGDSAGALGAVGIDFGDLGPTPCRSRSPTLLCFVGCHPDVDPAMATSPSRRQPSRPAPAAPSP